MGRSQTEHQKTVWATAASALGLLLYWVLFFGTTPEHRQGLLYLLIPDEVLLAWGGGDLAQFSIADRLPILLGVGCVFGLAFLIGRLSLAMARADGGLSRLEIAVLSVGVGLNELSLLTLAIGLAGGLHQPWAFAAPIVAVCSLAVLAWKRGVFQRGNAAQLAEEAGQAETPNWLTRRGLWMGLPFLALILLGGVLPPWDFDVREYHLQVPKEWFQQGRISFLPHNIYGNMPLGAEMHALLGMVFWPGRHAWWWGALVGKTVIACFAPLTALSLLAAGRRFASPTAGVVAALVYLSIPWVLHVSISGLIEGAVAFYVFSTLYAMLLWWTGSGLENNADGEARPRRGRLLLAGFLAGSAVACKYPALLFVLAPVVIWSLFGAGRVSESRKSIDTSPPSRWGRWRPRWRAGITILLAAACGCGLWLGKNWVLAGNPVYPLLFGGHTRTADGMEQWNRAHRVPPDGQGRRYMPKQAIQAVANVGWRSRWQSAILVPLSLTALLLIRKRCCEAGDSTASRWWPRDPERQLAVVCAVYTAFFLLAWWLVTHRIDRFWVPVLPTLAMLAGIGAAWSAARAWRSLLVGVLVCGLTANFLIVLGHHSHRYLVALDVLRVDEPDKPDGLSRLHAAHRYLNAEAPLDGSVLFVGDAQPFDLEVPVLYNTCFDECVFERLLKDRTPEQRRRTLHAQGISHVLINWSEIDRYRSPGNYGFTDYVTRDLVRNELAQEQALLRKLDLGVDSDRWELYEVVGGD